MSVERSLSTPHGPGRLVTDAAADPMATLLLSHGAGNGIETRDLDALAATLPAQGVSVVRLEQPWRVAGRRIATRPATLDDALLAAVEALADDGLPLVVGGRSAGARSAARCAVAAGAAGCLALAFPLHPPGRPERSRLPELLGAGVPTLLVQGERDPMGRPEEFPELMDGVEMCVVPGADHGLAVPARGAVSEAEAMEIVVESALEWLVREASGNGSRS
ncbi:alpha/beta family hydrolase [Nocardioides pantholopis]|uniref:alpha/beta hydrolase family protein n=1 Tax=Nocardioides pantholopis TaxID=2483798 RepID=UPI000F093CB1|nr:alpha/beta family hydrolase [Nocardioides pantholopis]